MWQQGVAHLDIKPDNVLYHDTPHGPWYVLADLGNAKSIDLASGRPLQPALPSTGAPEYQAPELALADAPGSQWLRAWCPLAAPLEAVALWAD